MTGPTTSRLHRSNLPRFALLQASTTAARRALELDALLRCRRLRQPDQHLVARSVAVSLNVFLAGNGGQRVADGLLGDWLVEPDDDERAAGEVDARAARRRVTIMPMPPRMISHDSASACQRQRSQSIVDVGQNSHG